LIRRLLIDTEDEKKRQNLIDTRNSTVGLLFCFYSLEQVTILPGTKLDKRDLLYLIRQDMERARLILEMSLKREMHKQSLCKLWQVMFTPLTLRFKIPEGLREEHSYLFTDPVIPPSLAPAPTDALPGEAMEVSSNSEVRLIDDLD
jgi:hypothetical protein